MRRSAFVHADLIPHEECEPSKRKGILSTSPIEQVDSVHGLLNGFASAKNPCSISSQYLREYLKHAPSTSRTDPESIRQQYYILLLLLLLLPRHNVILFYTHMKYIVARGILKTMCFEFEYCFESHTFTLQESIIVTYA